MRLIVWADGKQPRRSVAICSFLRSEAGRFAYVAYDAKGRSQDIFRHLHLESRYARNEWHALIRDSDEGTLRHAIRADYVIAVVRETFPWTETRKFADDAVTFDDNLLTQLVSDDPFPASNSDRFGRLIVDRYKVNKRVGSVRWRLECWHIDNFVDDHTKIQSVLETLNSHDYNAPF